MYRTKLKEVEISIRSRKMRHHHENNNDTQKDIKKLCTTEKKKGIQFKFQVPKKKKMKWLAGERESLISYFTQNHRHIWHGPTFLY